MSLRKRTSYESARFNLIDYSLEKIALSSDAIPASAFLIGRISGLELPDDRQEALLVQQPLHRQLLAELFPSPSSLKRFPFAYAEQCHGAEIALVAPPFLDTTEFPKVDGLITAHSEIILGVRVADCAPVWIVEKTGRVGALVHSGKRGTEAGIVTNTIARLQKEFQLDPSDLIVTIGPCIRPPCYEVDFASLIRKQAEEAGVLAIHDEQICTGCCVDRYYSYRREQGKTGHMLALLQLRG